jgi:hypothetical protein
LVDSLSRFAQNPFEKKLTGFRERSGNVLTNRKKELKCKK